MNRGFYYYGMPDFGKQRGPAGHPWITRHGLRVEIIGVRGANLRVRFLEFHLDGRGPGTEATVKAKNVYRDTPHLTTSGEPGRTPYKD